MPTPPTYVTLLELAFLSGKPLVDPAPWNYDEWQELTQRDHAPWAPEATPESTGLTADALDALKAFCRQYCAFKDERDRVYFALKPPAVDTKGRNAVRDWVATQWKIWGINGIIDECMEMHGRDMYTLAAGSGNSVRIAALSRSAHYLLITHS